MAEQRFPRSKYLRQLGDMQEDFLQWKSVYAEAAADHKDDWIGSRFQARADDLNTALLSVMELRDLLYQLPRLR